MAGNVADQSGSAPDRLGNSAQVDVSHNLKATGLKKNTCKHDMVSRTLISQSTLSYQLIYSQLSLSRSRRDPLKHFEISVVRHIRFAELRKIPIEQPNFTNEHVI